MEMTARVYLFMYKDDSFRVELGRAEFHLSYPSPSSLGFTVDNAHHM